MFITTTEGTILNASTIDRVEREPVLEDGRYAYVAYIRRPPGRSGPQNYHYIPVSEAQRLVGKSEVLSDRIEAKELRRLRKQRKEEDLRG